jgi:hypothetical protein
MAPDNLLRVTAAELDTAVAILARLGSNFDGEVLAAAAAFQRFLNSRGLTCRDLIAPAQLASALSTSFCVLEDWPRMWRAAANICHRAPEGVLPDWDRRFITTLRLYRQRPSSRQLDILATITAAVLAAGGGQ